VDGQVAMKLHPNYSLWWLALLILFLGGAVACYLFGGIEEGGPYARQRFSLCVAVTVLLAAICLIGSVAPFLFGKLRLAREPQ
jgi:hypothetical protein